MTPQSLLIDEPRPMGTLSTRQFAVFNHCRACLGWEGDGRTLREEVNACPNAMCHLWPFRAKKASLDPISVVLDKPWQDHGGSTKAAVLDQNRIKVAQNNASRGRARAIFDFCGWCLCEKPRSRSKKAAIEACEARECHLWPWRGGKPHVEEVLEER